jgi:hypothetical protein
MTNKSNLKLINTEIRKLNLREPTELTHIHNAIGNIFNKNKDEYATIKDVLYAIQIKCKHLINLKKYYREPEPELKLLKGKFDDLILDIYNIITENTTEKYAIYNTIISSSFLLYIIYSNYPTKKEEKEEKENKTYIHDFDNSMSFEKIKELALKLKYKIDPEKLRTYYPFDKDKDKIWEKSLFIEPIFICLFDYLNKMLIGYPDFFDNQIRNLRLSLSIKIFTGENSYFSIYDPMSIQQLKTTKMNLFPNFYSVLKSFSEIVNSFFEESFFNLFDLIISEPSKEKLDNLNQLYDIEKNIFNVKKNPDIWNLIEVYLPYIYNHQKEMIEGFKLETINPTYSAIFQFANNHYNKKNPTPDEKIKQILSMMNIRNDNIMKCKNFAKYMDNPGEFIKKKVRSYGFRKVVEFFKFCLFKDDPYELKIKIGGVLFEIMNHMESIEKNDLFVIISIYMQNLLVIKNEYLSKILDSYSKNMTKFKKEDINDFIKFYNKLKSDKIFDILSGSAKISLKSILKKMILDIIDIEKAGSLHHSDIANIFLIDNENDFFNEVIDDDLYNEIVKHENAKGVQDYPNVGNDVKIMLNKRKNDYYKLGNSSELINWLLNKTYKITDKLPKKKREEKIKKIEILKESEEESEEEEIKKKKVKKKKVEKKKVEKKKVEKKKVEKKKVEKKKVEKEKVEKKKVEKKKVEKKKVEKRK